MHDIYTLAPSAHEFGGGGSNKRYACASLDRSSNASLCVRARVLISYMTDRPLVRITSVATRDQGAFPGTCTFTRLTLLSTKHCRALLQVADRWDPNKGCRVQSAVDSRYKYYTAVFMVADESQVKSLYIVARYTATTKNPTRKCFERARAEWDNTRPELILLLYAGV